MGDFKKPTSPNNALKRIKVLLDEIKGLSLHIPGEDERKASVERDEARDKMLELLKQKQEEVDYLREWLCKKQDSEEQLDRAIRSVAKSPPPEAPKQGGVLAAASKLADDGKLTFPHPADRREAGRMRQALLEELDPIELEIAHLNAGRLTRQNKQRRLDLGRRKAVISANLRFLKACVNELLAEERRLARQRGTPVPGVPPAPSAYNSLLAKLYGVFSMHTPLNGLSPEELGVIDMVEEYLELKGFDFEARPSLELRDLPQQQHHALAGV